VSQPGGCGFIEAREARSHPFRSHARRFGQGDRAYGRFMICRLCGGSDLKPLYTQGARGEFAFFRCRTCRLVSYDLSAGLDQEKYSRELPDPMSSDDPRNASQSRTYSFIARRYARPGRLLDIGCGNGRLLHLAASDGWEVEGVEMPGGMAEKTAARLGVPVHEGVFPGSMPVLEGRFDLVVLRHVLEHIPDPPAAIEAIRSLLTEGGEALLEFPNIDGLDQVTKRMLERLGLRRKRYRPSYIPGHCCEYCRGSFRFLLERSGMVLERWETYSSRPWLDPLLRVAPLGGKARAIVGQGPPEPRRGT